MSTLYTNDLEPDVFTFSMSVGSPQYAIDNDPEVMRLRQQVEEYDKFVFILDQQIKERQDRYKSTLEKINEQIDKARHMSDVKAQSQIETQEQELEEMQRVFQSQLDNLRQTPRRTMAEEELWQKHHKEIDGLANDIKITELKTEITHVDEQNTTTEIHNLAKLDQTTLDNDVKVQAVVTQYQNLESEIDKFTSGLRDQRSSYLNILSELSTAQTMKKEYAEIAKNKIVKEMQKREKFFNKHIGIISQTISKEKDSMRSESQYLQNQLDLIRSTKRETVRRCTGLLNKVTTDIQKMKDVLNQVESSEEKELQMTTNSLSSFDSCNRQTQSNKQLEQELATEIENVRRQNQNIASYIEQLNRPTRATSGSPYKRSSFF